MAEPYGGRQVCWESAGCRTAVSLGPALVGAGDPSEAGGTILVGSVAHRAVCRVEVSTENTVQQKISWVE